jgi:hypothetical protein
MDGMNAITNPTTRRRAATTPKTAGPVVFDRNSMIRLNEYTSTATPRAAMIGNSSGCAMRSRTAAL